MKEFAIYIDDSGSPKPNPRDSTPYFAMGGVLIERGNEERIEAALCAFKEHWNIPIETPLHGSEIRAKRGAFTWLDQLPEDELIRFHTELAEMVTRCPAVVHACVISRIGYFKRYADLYGTETWEMMKTAFTILLERTVKFVASRDGKVTVYYEKIGRREDRLIESYFRSFRAEGHPFNQNNAAKYNPLLPVEVIKRLSGIEGKTKKNPMLQISDLCLYPIARVKDRPNDRAFVAMRTARMLVDDHIEIEHLASEGIKYYCFD